MGLISGRRFRLGLILLIKSSFLSLVLRFFQHGCVFFRVASVSFLSVSVNLKGVFVLKASHLIRFAHPSGRLSGAQRFAFVFYLCKRK